MQDFLHAKGFHQLLSSNQPDILKVGWDKNYTEPGLQDFRGKIRKTTYSNRG